MALVTDPTSIGVVAVAPIPASRTGTGASRSIWATAMFWNPLNMPMLAFLLEVRQDCGVAVAGRCQVRGEHPGRDEDGERGDGNGEDETT